MADPERDSGGSTASDARGPSAPARPAPAPPPIDPRLALELVEHGDGLCVLDPEFRIVFANGRFERAVGARGEQLVGRILWEVCPDAARPESRSRQEYHHVMRERVPVRFEEYDAPTGTWTGVDVYPLSDGAIAVSFRDISRQRRVEESLSRYAELVEHAPVLVRDCTRGEIQVWNKGMEKLYGWTRKEALGKVSHELLRTRFPGPPPQIDAVLLRDGRWEGELRHRRRDGSEVVVTSLWVLHRDELGRPEAIIEVNSDVTDRVRAEARAEFLARFPQENPDPVMRFGPRLEVLYANPAAVAAFGPLGLVAGAPAPAPLAGPARAALEEARRSRDEVACAGATFAVSVVPVGGEVNLYAQDISARKYAEDALRASEERLRLLVEHAPAAIAMFDRDMRYLAVSRRFVSDYRLGDLDLVGRSHYELFPDLPERWKEIHRRCLAGAAERCDEDQFARPDGTVSWLRWEIVPWRDAAGEVGGIVLFTEDVTERTRAEEALRESDRRKSEFLGVLSHELRNPLAPIRNSIYLLEKLPADSPQAVRARQVIRRQTNHLTRLVDDLLDVTRISRGKITLHREAVDLRNVVRKTCEDHRASFEEADVELSLDFPAAPVWADVDATRIAQVVGNLLHNASKFTPARGAVTVRLRARDGRAQICVRDTGAGMDPQQVGRMFEPFAQEDRSLARTRGGLGLGLALSKGLVELHGGTITARSEGPGLGAEFELTLPLAARPQGAAPPAAALGSGSRRRVLVVEDNLDAGRTLADVLEAYGHEVTLARDGAAGIALAGELKPDVVICDVGLPDVDGYEVARALRSDAALRSTRLVALSGYAQPEDRERAREAGFDAHLPKPAPLDELLALLD